MPGPIQRQRDTSQSARLRGHATPCGRSGRGTLGACAGRAIGARQSSPAFAPTPRGHQRGLHRFQHHAADALERLHAGAAARTASRCAPTTMAAPAAACPRPRAAAARRSDGGRSWLGSLQQAAQVAHRQPDA
jgi:hypothetical protein